MARFPSTRAGASARIRRRHACRRFAALVCIFVCALGAFETFVRWTHKAFVAPWIHVTSHTPNEWLELPRKCRRRLAFCLPLDVVDVRPGVVDARGTFERTKTYARMYNAAVQDGIEVFHRGATTTQGLSVDDMFAVGVDGQLIPKLMSLEIPVRAIVMPFPIGAVSNAMYMGTVKHLEAFGFTPNVNVYLQDPDVFHFSVFHASHHLDEHAVDADAYRTEAYNISNVTQASCPIDAILERVFVTSGGVVVAGWNVEKTSRGEPSRLRKELRQALPNAPENQLVSDLYILHTTLARIVGTPFAGADGRDIAKRMSQALTDELCGLELTLDTAWFVEEKHKLALALRGAINKIALPLACGKI